MRIFDLADGRELAWIEYGVDDGTPVIAFHGSPGTHHHFAGLDAVAAGRGVRLVAPDRPGYGHSSYHPARSYESWAHDVGQLADHLHIDHFAVIGHSSGGPNAAACARYLGDRLGGCAIVSGIAPPEAKISKDAMMLTNRITQRLAPVVPGLLGLVAAAGMRQGHRDPDKALAWMRGALPACDAAMLERPELRAALRADIGHRPAGTAGRAAVQDVEMELRPWGFRLRDIDIPVQVWHGELDRNVVVESGVYQATEIPRATLHKVPREGHWLVYAHFEEILDSVTA